MQRRFFEGKREEKQKEGFKEGRKGSIYSSSAFVGITYTHKCMYMYVYKVSLSWFGWLPLVCSQN